MKKLTRIFISVPLFVIFSLFTQSGYAAEDQEMILAEEFGVEEYFFEEAVATSLSRWAQKISEPPNAISVIAAEDIRYSNEDAGFARGLEFEAGHQWTDLLRPHANDTFERMCLEGDKQDEHPKQKPNLGARAELRNGFSIGLEAHRGDECVMEDILTGEQVEPDSYTRLDLRVAKEFLDGNLEVALVAQNLLDPNYLENYGVDVNRSVCFTVSWRL